MCTEHLWNNDREVPKYSEKNPSLCHSVHHKPHMCWYGIKTAFEVKHQQLTAWFMALPKIQSEELPGSSE